MHVLTITLPETWQDGYKTHFDKVVNGCVRTFLDDHPDVHATIDPDACLETLRNVGNAVRRNSSRLLVLVDEYDRAVVRQVAMGDVARVQETLNPLSGFLGRLKTFATGSNSTLNYFITGITPLAITDSLSNVSVDLTFDPDFSNVMGLTEAEFRTELRVVADVEPGEYLDRLMEVFRANFNGYNFVGSTEAVYNPQLVHHAARQVLKGVITFDCIRTDQDVLDNFRKLVDFQQDIDRHQLNMIARQPAIRRLLFNPDLELFPWEGLAPSFTPAEINNQAASYLYYRGVLTMKHLRSDATGPLGVPNNVIKYLWFQSLSKRLNDASAAMNTFMAAPSAAQLTQVCENIVTELPLSDDHNEADLSGPLRALCPQQSVRHELPPPKGDKRNRQDLVIQLSDSSTIIIELKTLTVRVPERKLHTEGVSVEAKVEELAAMSEDSLLAHGCSYSQLQGYINSKSGTVGDVLAMAMDQARKYLLLNLQANEERKKKTIVRCFAVVQVHTRFICREVFADPQA